MFSWNSPLSDVLSAPITAERLFVICYKPLFLHRKQIRYSISTTWWKKWVMGQWSSSSSPEPGRNAHSLNKLNNKLRAPSESTSARVFMRKVGNTEMTFCRTEPPDSGCVTKACRLRQQCSVFRRLCVFCSYLFVLKVFPPFHCTYIKPAWFSQQSTNVESH